MLNAMEQPSYDLHLGLLVVTAGRRRYSIHFYIDRLFKFLFHRECSFNTVTQDSDSHETLSSVIIVGIMCRFIFLFLFLYRLVNLS